MADKITITDGVKVTLDDKEEPTTCAVVKHGKIKETHSGSQAFTEACRRYSEI